jgi:hypothetical protein
MTAFPRPVNPALTVRPINPRLATVVETARPNCRRGYVSQTNLGGWLCVPAALAADFQTPQGAKPAQKQIPATPSQTLWPNEARAYNMRGDVRCPDQSCGRVHEEMAQFNHRYVACRCGHQFTAYPMNSPRYQ